MIYSIATVVFLILYAIVQVIGFAYFHRVFPQESECSDIPPDSVVLALGFEYSGEKNGVILPGDGNIALARQLAECVDRYSLILTQKAISDAMQQEGLLMDGKLLGKVPVQQMHEHQTGVSVRTLSAL